MNNRKAYIQQLLHSDNWSAEQWNWMKTYLDGEDLSELQAVAAEDFQLELTEMKSTLDKKVSAAMLANIHRRAGITDNNFRGVFRLYTRRIAAAAIGLLVISVAAYILLRNNSNMLIVSADKERTTVTLPDGSDVVLEKGASIRYPKNFGTNTRELTLKGEAYFNVKHAAKAAFTISSKYLKTTVLGTAFNMDVRDNEEVKVVVISGKVQVDAHNGNKTSARTEVLTANKELVLNTQTNEIQLIDGTDDARFYARKSTGVLTYKGESVVTVLRDLERIYNVPLDARNIRQCPIFSNFNINDDLRKQLDLIAAPFRNAKVNELENGKGFMITGEACE
ncbi:FecR family protein [Chitinophaga jiangningensis]|uniref:FecR family protein n=1 Tax=Chitinophaga jiangningensis TaxID=1419482 RepID=A0A1M7N367_9BACT|nr:FecR family protein [Chitinophaga jiangningensis]SHM97960.1 FecR family protein [Chitinophaga jiangningensis]